MDVSAHTPYSIIHHDAICKHHDSLSNTGHGFVSIECYIVSAILARFQFTPSHHDHCILPNLEYTDNILTSIKFPPQQYITSDGHKGGFDTMPLSIPCRHQLKSHSTAYCYSICGPTRDNPQATKYCQWLLLWCCL